MVFSYDKKNVFRKKVRDLICNICINEDHIRLNKYVVYLIKMEIYFLNIVENTIEFLRSVREILNIERNRKLRNTCEIRTEVNRNFLKFSVHFCSSENQKMKEKVSAVDE